MKDLKLSWMNERLKAEWMNDLKLNEWKIINLITSKGWDAWFDTSSPNSNQRQTNQRKFSANNKKKFYISSIFGPFILSCVHAYFSAGFTDPTNI